MSDTYVTYLKFAYSTAVLLMAAVMTLGTVSRVANAQVQTTLATGDGLPRLTEWLAPDADMARALGERPSEELVSSVDAGVAPFLVTFGRLAFRSPLIFGSYAARGGLTCDVCHTAGGTNPAFFVAEVSDRPGNVDVTHGFWRRESEDNLDNPINIPSLRGARWTAPYGRDGRFASLEAFTRNVIVHEFGGDEPSPLLLDALVAYQRALAFPENGNVGPAGRLTARAGAAARRGEALFLKDCAGCHVPSRAFVDGGAHDVGTGGHFDTPSLLGLAASAPYFHDGRTDELATAVAHFDTALRLGYDAAARVDLVAYLRAVGSEGARQPVTLRRDVADLRSFARVLDFPLNDEDFAHADLIAAMLRTEVGRIAERFSPESSAEARAVLEAWSRRFSDVVALAEADRFPAAREALAAWLTRVDADLPILARSVPASLYDSAILRRALKAD